VPYGVRTDNHRIDLDEVRKLAKEHRPKVLWCGTTAYPRTIDFAGFRSIADEVGAILAADIAHISGLVVAGVHPSPVGIADVITSTTHKTLRGPRGGMILCKPEHASAIDKAVFPGLQGGPHNHTTAGIAVAAHEAAQPEFKTYAKNIVGNARTLAAALEERKIPVTTGGTDNHLMLLDLSKRGIGGKPVAQALSRAGIVLNYNAVPFDTRKPFDPSGLRIGTPAVTSRGMGEKEMLRLADWILQVVESPADSSLQTRIAAEVKEMCSAFPAPGIHLT
jgi:glycine hydroxymethyltransferase